MGYAGDEGSWSKYVFSYSVAMLWDVIEKTNSSQSIENDINRYGYANTYQWFYIDNDSFKQRLFL